MIFEIVNPMYDVAFKYLVDDESCAKLLLGEIIEREIVECELLNNEVISNKGKKNTILKLDFKAKIKTSNNEFRLVIIEVQKALLDSNILRFRQYLGNQYRDRKNTYTQNGKKFPYPIIAIYFLGHNIDIANNIPILKVKPTVFDYATLEQINNTAPFIEGLTHELIIIQMLALKNRSRTHLERFLAHFSTINKQILAIDDQHIDKKFVTLIRRLHEATMKKEIVEQMQIENVLQEELDDLYAQRELAIKEKEEANRQKEEANRQKEEANRQKEEANRQKEEERIQKEVAIARESLAIHTMLKLGISIEIISEKLQIPISEIENILKK